MTFTGFKVSLKTDRRLRAEEKHDFREHLWEAVREWFDEQLLKNDLDIDWYVDEGVEL